MVSFLGKNQSEINCRCMNSIRLDKIKLVHWHRTTLENRPTANAVGPWRGCKLILPSSYDNIEFLSITSVYIYIYRIKFIFYLCKYDHLRFCERKKM